MKKESKPRGRPKSFDEAKALDVAVELFWSHGYEGTSVSDLVKAMGVTPPSLYAAFGSKKELYFRALDKYAETDGFLLVEGFLAENDLKQAFARMMQDCAHLMVKDRDHGGCMISVGLVSCSASNADISENLTQRRQSTAGVFLTRLESQKEQLPTGTNLRGLANYFAMAFMGMSVQARDGLSETEMREIADRIMDAWPQ